MSVAKMKKTNVGIFAAAMVACVAGTAFAEKDFGDFYTRAWYMVVDNPRARQVALLARLRRVRTCGTP